jgi:hypothetical protein
VAKTSGFLYPQVHHYLHTPNYEGSLKDLWTGGSAPLLLCRGRRWLMPSCNGVIFIPLTVVRFWVTIVLKEPFFSGWWSNYERCLKSSWIQFISPNQNFVEVRWRSLFRSTSLLKRCTSCNAPPTSRKGKRNNKASPRTFQTALV